MNAEVFPMDLTGEEFARVSQRRENAAKVERLLGHLDPGIAPWVAILVNAGVETYESCEGGVDPERPVLGHAYPEPTIRFHGQQGAGWWALQVCLDHGLPVRSLSRIWTLDAWGNPVGPSWQLVFTRKAEPDPACAHPFASRQPSGEVRCDVCGTPLPDAEVRRLLGYLWTATGRNTRIPVSDMFESDDPIVADIERLAIFPPNPNPTPSETP